MAKTLYLLDGHYQIYRAFFAPFGELTSPTGEPTRATYVFWQMLFNLLRNRRPDYLAMVMDVSDETTFRRDLDETYKAHRDPPPEALCVQAERIVAMIEAVGIPIYRLPGFEADDLLATIAHSLSDEDIEVFLVSRDKDLEQLLTDKVRLYDTAKDAVVDPATLAEIKGYTPEQALEIQTLTGDSTDNIPGITGVGLKTAIKLVKEYGSARAVLENADQLTTKMAERVKAFADSFELTRQLVTLRRDVPLAFDVRDCATDRLKPASLESIFDELGFGRLKEQLAALVEECGDSSAAPEAVDIKRKVSGEPGVYHLVDTPEQFDEFLAKLRQQTRFAFDTETTGLNPVAADLVGLSFSWKTGEGWYLPVRAMMGKVLPMDTIVRELKPIFEDQSVGKIGQNIKYDMLVLRQVGIETAGVVFDTRLASFLLDPLGRSNSLDALAKRWFDHDMIPISDLIGKGKNQITLDQVDTRQVSEYAAEDADFTWRLFEVLDPQITGSPVEQLFRETEVPLISVLTQMEHDGVALDGALLTRLGERMGNRMIELTREVYRAAGHEFNIDSTKQLATVLFDEQKLRVVKKTKTGRSTDHDTLETLVATTDSDIPTLVLEYRELAKLKSTYIDKLPKMVAARTGRIHASFDQTGTVTGRLSSRDPNLQNIPIRTENGRQIRHAFVAQDADHVLLSADYSQIELRLLAHFSRDDTLLEAFRGGEDIHRSVAAEVNGVPIDQVSPEQRSAAKAVNFGIIYGQSAFGLARSLGIPQTQAKAFIDSYFERYAGIRKFIDSCVEIARSRGYAQTILGRRRPVPELQSRSRQQIAFGERIAVNTVVQGSAADLIKRAMIDLYAVHRSGELAARMLIQVHDELVFEIPKEHLDRDGKLIRHKMEHALELDVPIVVDLASGANWADSK